MRKLKLSVLLPVILFPVSCLLFVLYQKFQGQPRLYVPIDFFLTCLNVPAWLLGGALAAFLKALTPRNVYISFGGIEPKKLLSLLLVIPAWWWVGRTIEQLREVGKPVQASRLKDLLANLALVVLGWGLLMLFIGQVMYLIGVLAPGDAYVSYLKARPFVYLIVPDLVFAAVWPLFLIIFPGIDLLYAIRSGALRQLPFFRQE